MLLQGRGQAKVTAWEHDYYKNRVELSFSAHGLINKIWAGTSTYQVVCTLKQFPHLPAITADYCWVPKIAAKASLVNHPQIPAGFTQVAYGSQGAATGTMIRSA